MHTTKFLNSGQKHALLHARPLASQRQVVQDEEAPTKQQQSTEIKTAVCYTDGELLQSHWRWLFSELLKKLSYDFSNIILELTIYFQRIQIWTTMIVLVSN